MGAAVTTRAQTAVPIDALVGLAGGMLLPSSTDDRWEFRRDVPGYSRSHYTIGWLSERPVGVSDLRAFDYWTNVAKRAAIQYATGGHVRRVTSVINFTRNVRSLCLWLGLSRKRQSTRAISREDIRAYEDYLRTLQISRSSADARLSAFRALWMMREMLGFEFSVKIYSRRGDLRTAARRVGVPDGRTRTLAPDYYFKLLDESIRMVSEGSDVLQRLEKYLDDGRPRRSGGNALIQEARLLYGACCIVIFSLYGDRKHQAASISVAQAVLAVDSGLDLRGRVFKVSNGSGGEPTNAPVLPELRMALEVLLRMTGGSDVDGELPLIRVSVMDQALKRTPSDPLDSPAIYRLIQGFARHVGIDVVLRPHMFRRAFSMIYIWRYELGDLDCLKRILRHRSFKHTLAYVEGDDVFQFASDSRKELAYNLMERAMSGAEAFAGGFGSLLARLARRLRSSTVVLRPEQVDDWLRPSFDRGEVHLRPGPQGYCVVVGDRGRKAACSTSLPEPDLVNRTDQHCAGCSNFLATGAFKDYWQRSLDVHQKVLDSSQLELVRKNALAGVCAAKRVLSQFGGEDVE